MFWGAIKPKGQYSISKFVEGYLYPMVGTIAYDWEGGITTYLALWNTHITLLLQIQFACASYFIYKYYFYVNTMNFPHFYFWITGNVLNYSILPIHMA